MPSVGTAYVNVRVNTRGFEAGLDSMLKRLSAKMEKAGADLGKDFDRGLKKTNFDNSFKPLTTASGKATTKVRNDFQAISDMADRMGVNISDAADVGSSGLDVLQEKIGEVRGEMGGLSRASSGAGTSLGGLGGGGARGGAGLRAAGDGGSFLSRQLDDIAAMAPRAQKTLAGLFNTAAFGGTALAGLVGGLSAAAQGIFVIGANAAAAAPALAVMTNGLLSLAQVGTVAALASKGVGEALSAGFDAAGESATGMGTATASAARAIRDAKDALADAYQNAARAAADAARRTADAERALAEAQMATAAAQRELNLARAEALEQLEDIGFAAEDAALSEDRAALALADAHQALLAVSELAPDDRARIEAELAFKEAELNYRQAKDRRQDADKDQREAAKKGVEGTEAMQDARANLADAEQAEADAVRNLADARREEAEQAADSAEAIADAQQALADAYDRSAVAMGTATAAADKFDEALAKLGPNQQAFVRRILGMQEEFQAFRNAVAEPLFDHLLDAIDTIEGSGLTGVIQEGLIGTANALGEVAEEGAKVAASEAFQTSLGDAMAYNNEAVGNFGSAMVSVADAFVQVADAAGPVFVDFSEWVEDVADGWAETARLNNTLENANDKFTPLERTIRRGADRVREFWGLATELWRTLRILGGAANRAANQFGDVNRTTKEARDQGYISSLSDSLDKFNDKLEKNPGLVKGFDQALRNLNAVGGAFKNVILDPLMALGQDPDVEKAFRTLSETDAFDRLAETAGNALPDLAELVVNVAELLASLSETGTIEAFVDALADFTGAIRDVVDWATKLPGAGRLLGIAGAALGTYRAVKLLYGGFKFLTAGILGDVRKVTDKVKGFVSGFKGGGGLKGGFAGAAAAGGGEVDEAGDLAKITTAISGAAGRIVLAIEACCATLARIMGASALGGAAGGGIRGAAPAPAVARGPIVGPGGAAAMAAAAPSAATTGKVGKFASIFGKLGKVLGPVTKAFKFLGPVLRVFGFAFRFLLGPIGIIVLTLLPLLWPLLKKLEEKTGIFSKTLDALKWALGKVVDFFQFLWDKMKDLFGWIKDNWPLLLAILTGPIGLAVLAIIKNWDKIIAFIKGVPDKIKKFLEGMWDFIVENATKMWTKIKNIWNKVFTFIKSIPRRFVNGLKNIWNVVTDKLQDAWEWVKDFWWKAVAFGDRIEAMLKNALKDVWNVIKDKLGDAWDWVQNKWESIKNAISRWPGQIKESLSGLWDGMLNGLATALNWIGNKLNGLIGNLNSVLNKFGVDDIGFTFRTDYAFAKGGPVLGPGTGTSDSIPARLSHGEHVWTAAEVRAMGGHRSVAAMRKAALRGDAPLTGQGGIIGWFQDKYSTIKDAIKAGAAAAFKWALSTFRGLVTPADNIIKEVVLGALDWAADKISGTGGELDEEAAAEAGSYTGPHGKWMNPLGGAGYVVTTWPNSGGHTGGDANAIDMAIGQGAKIFAASAGKVLANTYSGGGYGNYVVIAHAGGESSLYAHMLHKSALKVGQTVKTGALVGYVDSTGNSTGNHLHFELDPNYSTVEAMRKHGVRLGTGGIVAPSSTGTLALIAESGKSERVTPLDSEGFTPAERRMLEALENRLGDGDGGDTYNVHPTPGMDETALADLVIRRVAWKRRRGSGWR